MTKRIEELSKEANAWYPNGYPSGEGGDAAWENLVIFKKENLTKFTELIVNECLDICKDVNRNPYIPDEDQVKQIIKNITKHFGVEE